MEVNNYYYHWYNNDYCYLHRTNKNKAEQKKNRKVFARLAAKDLLQQTQKTCSKTYNNNQQHTV